MIPQRAILFDLDGTLVDSLADLGESMNGVLTRSGFPAHPIDAYRHFVGDGMRNLVWRSLPVHVCDQEQVAAAVAAFRAAYAERWHLLTRPYPGTVETLNALHRRGFALAVLTNKPHELAQRIVERFFGRDLFAAVLGAENGFAGKPDPAGALELARRMSVPASACVYVGDTATDMRTAVAARMIALGALWGFRTAKELSDAGATRLVQAPAGLLEAVDALWPGIDVSAAEAKRSNDP
jgi:phosphoglycolate phosphatase